jgi:nitroimidazol reductase NimA-like FMN-containing flavoprotein (pyridoxamine 5'-phosphate oxidase superfamily)
VDQVYNTDKNEHARALYHLWKLFAQVKNDAARAEGCKERLLKDKDFAGLDYQKRAEREDKAGGMK